MKTREQMIEAANADIDNHDWYNYPEEFAADFALEQMRPLEARIAELERQLAVAVDALEWLEQNASEIRAFVQNPDRNIGVGWPVTISVNKYRGEITFHVSGELPGTATSLLDAIQRASTQCVKGGDDA